MKSVQVIDSHTAGEPTRVVIDGAPDLKGLTVAEKCDFFRSKFARFRSGVIKEPRGSDVLVGALSCESPNTSCKVGVIFFNNVDTLGMCGHGMIGVVTTLAFLGRLTPGKHLIDTPVGPVGVELHDDGEVSIRNVACYRKAANVTVDVPGMGLVCGDIAWGGNWFYLVSQPSFSLVLSAVDLLTDAAWRIRQAINSQGYPEVDHVEFFGPPASPENNSRNFVLCPGKAYDRSPCGTGTSAKVACLAADAVLAPGQIWRQESIIGSVFHASYEVCDDVILPTIKGRAWICGKNELLFDPEDPFRDGIQVTDPSSL